MTAGKNTGGIPWGKFSLRGESKYFTLSEGETARIVVLDESMDAVDRVHWIRRGDSQVEVKCDVTDLDPEHLQRPDADACIVCAAARPNDGSERSPGRNGAGRRGHERRLV